jgi:hypothetical protein
LVGFIITQATTVVVGTQLLLLLLPAIELDRLSRILWRSMTLFFDLALVAGSAYFV